MRADLHINRKRIAELHNAGLSSSVIAARLGIRVVAVAAAVRRAFGNGANSGNHEPTGLPVCVGSSWRTQPKIGLHEWDE